MGEASEVVIPLFGILDITGEVITMWLIIATLFTKTSYGGFEQNAYHNPGSAALINDTPAFGRIRIRLNC